MVVYLKGVPGLNPTPPQITQGKLFQLLLVCHPLRWDSTVWPLRGSRSIKHF
jgi:hypothetical protein